MHTTHSAPARAPPSTTAPLVPDPPVPQAPGTRFNELKISPGTLNAIAAMGYETPSPIQAQAIPVFLAGRDLLAQARTGTGKTAAFGIPLVEALRNHRNAGILGLVLVPTRELAIQVSAELADLAKGAPIRIVTIYGGVGFGKQTEALRSGGTQLVVATPGRLLDLVGQGLAKLGNVKHLVLDEADRMLDMGFLPDMEKVLRLVPQQRQTGLFSATVPDPIRRLSSRFLKDPVSIRIETGATATPTAVQFKFHLEKSMKVRALLKVLADEKPEQAMIFTRTKHVAKRLARNLEAWGFPAVALQGNMSQNARERSMEAFRSGEAKLLVATDIASRGIDVVQVSHVINFDLPDEPEAYVHRIGRTARMGRTGRAFTFVQSDEQRDMRVIENLAGTRIQLLELGELPPEPQAPKGQSERPPNPGHGRRSGPGHHAKKQPESGGGHSGRSWRGGGRRGSGGGGYGRRW
ncbi:MAG TPA: DEAD/DEAH box helicase [Candidatus Thermoplasmatota archaeon]|nr:DEAD/DEAH box helicase [Candidatus Thermoplasmatota archaeon]